MLMYIGNGFKNPITIIEKNYIAVYILISNYCPALPSRNNVIYFCDDKAEISAAITPVFSVMILKKSF